MKFHNMVEPSMEDHIGLKKKQNEANSQNQCVRR